MEGVREGRRHIYLLPIIELKFCSRELATAKRVFI